MNTFCGACGTPLVAEKNFCGKCGAGAVTPVEAQVAAKARYAASVAAATGNVTKDAFMATLKGATSVGDKAVVFGALVGVISFFLPWINLFGTFSGTGLRIALDGSAWIWLYPASLILCFVMFSFLKKADATKRVLSARWYIVIGTLWFAPSLAAVCNVFSGVVGVGGYLVAASSGAILLGGLLQVGERLDDCFKTT
jgi:hypothetical protein